MVGPVIFSWVGAASGGVVSFVRHFDWSSDRVRIEYIVPWALFGAACGLCFGFAVRAVYLRDGGR